MVVKRTCKATAASGQPCRAAPLKDSSYCFTHDPDRVTERQQARRLGGLRRRREKAVSQAYRWGGLHQVAEIQRLLEIAVADTLSLDASIRRSRTLGYLSSLALKTLEIGELEARVSALEQLLESGRR